MCYIYRRYCYYFYYSKNFQFHYSSSQSCTCPRRVYLRQVTSQSAAAASWTTTTSLRWRQLWRSGVIRQWMRCFLAFISASEPKPCNLLKISHFRRWTSINVTTCSMTTEMWRKKTLTIIDGEDQVELRAPARNWNNERSQYHATNTAGYLTTFLRMDPFFGRQLQAEIILLETFIHTRASRQPLQQR